jgi:hypothetical protein
LGKQWKEGDDKTKTIRKEESERNKEKAISHLHTNVVWRRISTSMVGSYHLVQ